MLTLLEEQWDRLRAWMTAVDVVAHSDQLTALSPWTVRDLVAHLGYALHLSVDVRPAAQGAVPLSLGDYVSQYPPAGAAISRATRDLASTMPDLLSGVDALAARAFAALHDLDGTRVVQARRGPLTFDDFVRTRLIELVVHADDLLCAIPSTRSPMTDGARTEVARTFARAYELKTRHELVIDDELQWVREAAGRVATNDPDLPLL